MAVWWKNDSGKANNPAFLRFVRGTNLFFAPHKPDLGMARFGVHINPIVNSSKNVRYFNSPMGWLPLIIYADSVG
jgi:hypothetical protein